MPAARLHGQLGLTDYLRHRFRQEKIYLLGHSGGSIISVLAVQRQPEKYRAYIGTGQAIDLVATDRIAYHDILAWARSTGRNGLARQLLAADVEQRRTCISFGLTLAKSTRTHHFRVLREAGVVRQWDAGNAKLNVLRVDDLDARFPGLLQAILAAEPRVG